MYDCFGYFLQNSPLPILVADLRIIKKISDENLFDLSKMVVLTGNNKVEEKLKDIGLKPEKLRIVYKPIDFEELSSVLKRVLGENV